MTVRHADDFYRTPAWAVKAIWDHVTWSYSGYTRIILDPCCGDGAILNVARNHFAQTIGIEINEQRAKAALISSIGGDEGLESKITVTDALDLDPWPKADIVLTNPPYKLAEYFVQKSLRQLPNAIHAFLLRIGFLASIERAEFHKQYPSDVYVLSKRPEFCMSVKCNNVPSRCDWITSLPIGSKRPNRCLLCGGSKLAISTSDSSEYAWFVWGPGRGGKWSILEVPSF
jgi:N-6 DNA Methylase